MLLDVIIIGVMFVCVKPSLLLLCPQVFKILVRKTADESWVVFRRYTDFSRLNDKVGWCPWRSAQCDPRPLGLGQSSIVISVKHAPLCL